jgi:hypothetical protein
MSGKKQKRWADVFLRARSLSSFASGRAKTVPALTAWTHRGARLVSRGLRVGPQRDFLVVRLVRHNLRREGKRGGQSVSGTVERRKASSCLHSSRPTTDAAIVGRLETRGEDASEMTRVRDNRVPSSPWHFLPRRTRRWSTRTRSPPSRRRRAPLRRSM